jgi:hypothetical protein
MHTQSPTPSVMGTKINPTIQPMADQFSLLAGHAGLVEFSYTAKRAPAGAAATTLPVNYLDTSP